MLLRFFRLIFEVLTEVEKHEKDNSVKFIPSAVKDLSDQFCVVVFFCISSLQCRCSLPRERL